MVSGLKAKTYEQRLLELDLPTLEARRHRGDMIQVHRILTGVDRVNPSTWFDLARNQPRGGATATRHSTGIRTLVPRTGRTEKRRNFFTCRTPAKYNSLPVNVRAAETINGFKNALDTIPPHNKPPARGRLKQQCTHRLRRVARKWNFAHLPQQWSWRKYHLKQDLKIGLLYAYTQNPSLLRDEKDQWGQLHNCKRFNYCNG